MVSLKGEKKKKFEWTRERGSKKHPRPAVAKVGDLVPNTWNMNKMEPSAFTKLKTWIERSYRDHGRLALPIVVRPKDDGYEIIDGEHRWRAAKELGQEEVDVHIYDCDDKAARLLTEALNYLRGAPDMKKMGAFIQELNEYGLPLSEIAAYTSRTEEELEELVLEEGIVLEEPDLGDATEEEDKDPAHVDAWVEIKFLIPVAAAEVVEAEISRISSVLEGKQTRGRALEYMAVLSSQTPMESLIGTIGEETPRLSISGKKKKRAA